MRRIFTRRRKGQPTGGQFAPQQRHGAALALEEQPLTETQAELADIIQQAGLGNVRPAPGHEPHAVRVTAGPGGRDYTVEMRHRIHVTTTDSAGRQHRNPHLLVQSFNPYRDAETIAGAMAQVREAAHGAEALDAAVAESGAQGTNFAGASFYFDHFMYGTGYCLLVPKDEDDDSAVAWDHYISRGYDEETKQPTDTVEVYRSPNLPVPPEERAKILRRATGIDDLDQAAAFAEKVGSLALQRYHEKAES